jgi:hypothetical protein
VKKLDSGHIKGLSSELNHNLGCIHEITGFVKTSARVKDLVDTNVEELSKLTIRDILVFYGGSNDVSKNSLNRGLAQQINYLKNNQHMNITVISVPQRYDLDSDSCINAEVNKYNRKLSNLTKCLNKVALVNVVMEREYYTEHGNHLNVRGNNSRNNSTAE